MITDSNEKIQNLVKVAELARDENWEKSFLEALIHGHINIANTAPKAGPDGWPYLSANTAMNAKEPTMKVVDWLCTRGIGLVVNPDKEMPDYILTYGMIWNFKERGQFFTPLDSTPSKTLQLDSGSSVLAGPPSEDYLPPYVRNILRQFFKAQGVGDPKILVMSEDRIHYDLCFSLESLGNPPKDELDGIAEAIGWFLPLHYSLVLISEKGLPEFHSL